LSIFRIYFVVRCRVISAELSVTGKFLGFKDFLYEINKEKVMILDFIPEIVVTRQNDFNERCCVCICTKIMSKPYFS